MSILEIAPPAVDVRERVRDVARRLLAPQSAAHDQAETLNREAWCALPDTGLWQVPLDVPGPEGWREFTELLCVLAEEGDDLGFVLTAIAHSGLLRALAVHGTEEQKQTWLPHLTSGGIGCTALTEPRGGSDVSRTTTTARPTDDGYLLTGVKDHITNAPVAEFGLILGRVSDLPERRDITLFLVDFTKMGVRQGDHESLLGLRTSPTGRIELDAVELDGASVLGAPGQGLQTLYDIISYDRLLYGLVAAAALKPKLREVLAHCARREAFGAPLTDYQYVQQRITDIALGIRQSESVSWDAHHKLFVGHPSAPMACSMAKYVGSTQLASAAQDLLCLYGHAGYMRGPTTRFLQDALGTLIAGGTSEMQRKNIFGQLQAQGGLVS